MNPSRMNTLSEKKQHLEQYLLQKGHEVNSVICPEYQFESAKEEQDYIIRMELYLKLLFQMILLKQLWENGE